MNAPVRKLRLPPLESVWSWPRYVSPHLADLEEECLEWSASFGAFDPETQRLIHDYGKLSKPLSSRWRPRGAVNPKSRPQVTDRGGNM